MTRSKVTSRYQDTINVLLIVLKFILVMIIGLQGIQRQLGMSPSDSTGVVNTTPDVQSSIEPKLEVSFYPIFYVPGSDYRRFSFPIKVEAWRCDENNGTCAIEQWNERTNDDLWTPQGWVYLGDRIKQMEAQDTSAPIDWSKPVEILSFEFPLQGEQESDMPIPGTYHFVYRVQIDFRDETHTHWKRSNSGQIFETRYNPEDEGEWRLPPLRIVRGRSGSLPGRLRGFSLETGKDSRLELDVSAGSFRIADYRQVPPDGNLEETIEVTSTVADVDQSSQTITVNLAQGQSRTVRLGRTGGPGDFTRFLEFNPDRNSYVRGEFSEVSEGDRIYFELLPAPVEDAADGDRPQPEIAELVRFGERVPAVASVVVQDNVSPRAVYRGTGGASERTVLLYFPSSSFVSNYRQLDERWYFNLSRYVIDPDGADGVHIANRNIRPGSSWPSALRLEVAPDGTGDTHAVFDPRDLLRAADSNREVRGQLILSDEWNRRVPVQVVIRILFADQIQREGAIVQNVLGN